MNRLLCFMLILFTLPGFAGDKIGNGGGIWECRPSDGSAATQIVLVDFFEARVQQGWLILPAPVGVSPDQYADQIGATIHRDLPDFAAAWDQALAQTRAHWRLVDADLAVIDDALYELVPPSGSCHGKWTYAQFANFDGQGQVLVAQNLWQSPLVSVEEKAGLQWHEALYLWLRTNYRDTTSVRARLLTGLVFSNQSAADKQARLAEILGTSPLPPPPAAARVWFCSLQNRLTFQVFGSAGDSELEAKTAVTDQCQSAGQGFHCANVPLVCEQTAAAGNNWTCVDQNLLTMKSYTGKGRGQIEAEYASVAACQKANPEQFLHCARRAPECVKH